MKCLLCPSPDKEEDVGGVVLTDTLHHPPSLTCLYLKTLSYTMLTIPILTQYFISLLLKALHK